MKQIGLLICDLDGTLVDTLEDIAASVNATLRALGRAPIAVDAVRQYVGDGIEMLLKRAWGGADTPLKAISVYRDHHRQNLVHRTRLYPGVRETLDYFRPIPLAIVTNKTREFSLPILEQLGIGDRFARLIGADEGLPLKPAPDALQAIMHDLGKTPQETVIVGDGTTDIKAGKAAGVATCAATYGFRARDVLLHEQPDYVINSFAELTALFAPRKG